MYKFIKRYFADIKRKYLINHYLSFNSTDYINILNPLIMHISDIPYGYYNFIFSIVEILNPVYIVHTGDIIDNLKLEINNKLKSEYDFKMEKLLKRFGFHRKTFFILLEGNHDDFSYIDFSITDNIPYNNIFFLKTNFKNISDLKTYREKYLNKISSLDRNLKISFVFSFLNKEKNKNSDFKEVDFEQIEFNRKDFIYNLAYFMVVENKKIMISHVFNKIVNKKQDIDFYLFGHDLTEPSSCNCAGIFTKGNKCKYLNGLNYINLIYRDSNKIVRINYPSTINECRKIRRKIIRGM